MPSTVPGEADHARKMGRRWPVASNRQAEVALNCSGFLRSANPTASHIYAVEQLPKTLRLLAMQPPSDCRDLLLLLTLQPSEPHEFPRRTHIAPNSAVARPRDLTMLMRPFWLLQ